MAARLFGIGRAGVVWGALCGACCWEVAGGAAEDSAGASGAVGVDGSVAAEEVEGSIGETAVVLELPEEPYAPWPGPRTTGTGRVSSQIRPPT